MGMPELSLDFIYFYPRSPRGERRPSHCPIRDRQTISTRAPREGSDCKNARRHFCIL